jgi:hypothetical protein
MQPESTSPNFHAPVSEKQAKRGMSYARPFLNFRYKRPPPPRPDDKWIAIWSASAPTLRLNCLTA